MLLELVIDFHAWSAARPVFESDKTADVLEKEVKSLVDTEKEQGMSSSSMSISRSPSLVGREATRSLYAPAYSHLS